MPRKKYQFMPELRNKNIDCFAFYRNKSGKPCCRALNDIYCLKDYAQCSFYATPAKAAAAAKRAELINIMKGRK